MELYLNPSIRLHDMVLSYAQGKLDIMTSTGAEYGGRMLRTASCSKGPGFESLPGDRVFTEVCWG
jgi:hypothetical protein